MMLTVTYADTMIAAQALVLLLVLLTTGELARRWLNWPAEWSRKWIHTGTAMLVVIAPSSFDHATLPIVMALPFLAINLIAVPRRWLPSMHAIARQSWGTVTFPLAFVALALTCWAWAPQRVVALQIAFLVMGLADPVAALVGQRWGRDALHIQDSRKTVLGMAAFALTAALVTWLGLSVWTSLSVGSRVWLTLMVTATTTLGEALSSRGWDNLVIAVMGAASVVAWLESPASHMWMPIALAVSMTGAIAALRLRFLQPSGALAAALLGVVLLGLGGWIWFVPALAFFLLSSALSKLGRPRKAQAARYEVKGSQRDAGQVYANGGVAGWMMVLTVLVPSPLWYWGFLGAIAAATADTWATEFGTYFRAPTRHILTGDPVRPGLSGGVSWPGSMGSVLGAAVIACTLLMLDLTTRLHSQAAMILVVTGAGVLGALADSVAGATVQALYRHPITGQLTERAASSQGPHRLVRGRRWIDNDFVNLFCTLVGATTAILAAALSL